MMQTKRALFLLAAVVLIVGCGADAPVVDEAAAQVATYTARGRVLTMPSEPGGEIQLEHEAIHDFVNFRGDVVGMDAMTMEFPLAEGAAGEIVAGDIVEFDLQVNWDAEPLSSVTRLEKLPADTELVFGRAEPPTE
jgi:Cu/Ag efflux protein CusF